MSMRYQASIFFQQELKIAEATDRKKVVDAVSQRGVGIMMNGFGNWAVQRCLEPPGTSRRTYHELLWNPCFEESTGLSHIIKLLIVLELLLGDPFSTLLNKHSAHVWSKIIWALPAPPIFAYVTRTTFPSFTSTLLDESLHPDAKIDKETMQNMAAMAYAAGAALHPPSSLYPLNIYHRSTPRCFRFRSMNVSGALYGRHGARNYVRLWRYAYPELSLGNDVCT
ncbi:hypothetical protein JB92DRAFT_2827452 [Gautieria morchelliformis]|nr:hypothetical protein JB92DRAFT_2827452 [Gautieria morchelliformis]